MGEVQQTISEYGIVVESRTSGTDPWTILVYLEKVSAEAPGLLVRPLGLRDATIRVSVWNDQGDRLCRFEHHLPRGSVASLRALARVGGVTLHVGYRVELFRLESSGPIQLIANGALPQGRLV